jgi:hypothetical protein
LKITLIEEIELCETLAIVDEWISRYEEFGKGFTLWCLDLKKLYTVEGYDLKKN